MFSLIDLVSRVETSTSLGRIFECFGTRSTSSKVKDSLKFVFLAIFSSILSLNLLLILSSHSGSIQQLWQFLEIKPGHDC